MPVVNDLSEFPDGRLTAVQDGVIYSPGKGGWSINITLTGVNQEFWAYVTEGSAETPNSADTIILKDNRALPGGAYVVAGGGNDRVTTSGGDDQIYGDVYWLLGVNQFRADATGNDNLFAAGGDDTVAGGNGNDTVDGGIGNDLVLGGAGDDVVRGGDGNDELSDGSGKDLLDGGKGDDDIDVSLVLFDDSIGDGAGDTVKGGDGNDTISNIRNLDNIDGGADDDRFQAVYFQSEGGTLIINGGAGFDSLDLNYRGNKAVNFNGATNTGIPGVTLSGIEKIDKLVTGAGNDRITVVNRANDDGPSVVQTGDGNDTLLGGLGHDGGLNGFFYLDDSFDTGRGNDVARTFAGNDVVTNLAGRDTIDTGSGDDRVRGYTGSTGVVEMGAGSDLFHSDFQNNVSTPVEYTVSGGAGNDVYVPLTAGTYVFKMGQGQDWIAVKRMDYQINGYQLPYDLPTTDADRKITVDYAQATQEVVIDIAAGSAEHGDPDRTDIIPFVDDAKGSRFNDEIIGDETDNRLFGGGGNDIIFGGGGNDDIAGEAGDDILQGGEGDDVFNGGTGDKDIVSFQLAAGAIIANLTNNTVSGQGIDAIAGIEGLTGSEFNDKFTGNAVANQMIGVGGNDSIRGLAGDDLLIGADGSDTLEGGADNDTLTGGAGADVVTGGDGDDTLSGGAGADDIDGGEGRDLIDYGKDDAGGTQGIRADLRNGSVTDTTGAKDGLSNVEEVIGTGRSDNFFSGHSPLGEAPVLRGAGGNDFFFASTTRPSLLAPDQLSAEYFGEAGADTFKLGFVRVDVDGGAGRDTLDASTYIFRDQAIEGLVIDLQTGNISRNSPPTNDEFREGPDLLGAAVDVEVIIGTARYDAIRGGAANDSISGGASFDVLNGGIGNDTIVGGADDNDAFIDSAGNDTYRDADGASLAYRESVAAVRIDFQSRIVIGNGRDTFDIANAAVIGSRFNDTISASNEDEWASGFEGNDIIVVRPSHRLGDEFFGGTGSDTVSYAGRLTGMYFRDEWATFPGQTDGVRQTRLLAYDTINVNDGIYDKIREVEHVEASALGDIFEFSAWDLLHRVDPQEFPLEEPFNGTRNMRFDGEGGDDAFIGIHGRDTFDGGIGEDLIDVGRYGFADVTARVDLAQGFARRGAFEARLISIENALGGSGNDTIAGSSLANELSGDKGADSISGAAGNDSISGEEGNDFIRGDAGNDTINGGLHNDTIIGGLGNDRLNGGLGTDTLTYATSAAAVTVNLETGVASGEGADILDDLEVVKGSAFADRIIGSAVAETLEGNAGNDTLTGGLGNDTMIGAAGTDTLDFSASTKAITVNLQAGTAIGEGSDKFTGMENFIGGKFNDLVTGSVSNNRLSGGAGLDRLDGDTGLDTLTGGAGADTFVIDKRDAIDIVTDFVHNQDTLAIDNAMFTGLTSLLPEGPLRAAYFIANANPVATREAQFLYETDTGILRFDGDGAGGAGPVMVVRLESKPVLTASDIDII